MSAHLNDTHTDPLPKTDSFILSINANKKAYLKQTALVPTD